MCDVWWSSYGELYMPWACDEAIIELPQVYPRSKADPNDLIVLAASAGRARQVIGWAKSRFVLPREWKGNLDGDLMTVRILQQLSDAERRVYFAAIDKIPEGSHDNVADSVGIGLWKLGRLTAAKVAANKKTRSKRK